MLIQPRPNIPFTLGRRFYQSTLIYDTFTAADGTNIHGRTPDITVAGATWSVITSTMSIQGNQLAGGAAIAVATIDAGVANYRINAQSLSAATPLSAVLVRYLNTSNFFQVLISAAFTPRFAIYEVAAGVTTLRASASPSISTGQLYTLNITVSGTTITALNTETGTTISYASATANQSSTVVGVRTVNNAQRMDNFEVLP